MYTTEINGRKAYYYDDRLEIADLTIPYGEMYSITQSFEDTPVFRFQYKGFDFRVACREDEYEKVLGYFLKAAELSPNTDPIKLLDSAKKRPAGKDPETSQQQENTASTYNTYTYNYYGGGNGAGEDIYDGPYEEGVRFYSKPLFVWLGTFLFGVLGIDRFMRGQIGLGLIKLFTGGCWGFLYLYDWIQAMIKAYGSAYRDTDYLYFNADGSYTR